MAYSEEVTRDMLRKIRRRIKDDLIKVQGLSSKLEARELQLRQSQTINIHPSMSDAQFSGNGFSNRCAGGGKEVTSQLELTHNGSIHTPGLTKQQSFAASNGSPIQSGNKPKMQNRLESSSRKVNMERKNMPPPAKSNTARENQNRQETFNNEDGMHPLKSNTPYKSESRQETQKNEDGNLRCKSQAMLNEYRMQCRNVLKKLMVHDDGWIFNEPVDAVKLGLSDYHTIIKKPMDLGTIKTKLEKKQYASISEFADDVRLTFKNAMTYNPKGNDVHESASMLLSIFQKDWDVLQQKFDRGDQEGQLNKGNKQVSESLPGRSVKDESPVKKSTLPKKVAAQEKSKGSTSKPKSLPGKNKTVQGTPKGLSAKPKTINKSEVSEKTKSAVNSETVKGDTPTSPKSAANPAAATKPKVSGKPKTPAKREAPTKPKTNANQKLPEKPNTKPIAKSNAPKASKGSANLKSSMVRKAMTYEEKVGLQSTLGQLPQHKLEELILLMKERNVNMSQEGDEIEVDLDSFDDDTLWEMDRRAKECLKDIQNSSENKKRLTGDVENYNITKKPKVMPENNALSGNKSSSGSDSSSDSDSGSSSGSDSDR